MSWEMMRKKDPKKEPLKQRLIHINNREKNSDKEFSENSIYTAKYNYLTFLPKFLFEQFSKYANIFFLMISIIQQIPNVSPTSRFNTILPLLAVLGATAVKEILEDFKRHQSDDEVNNRSCMRLSENGKFESILWKQVQVGDIIRIENSEFFPSDLILLSSSEPDGLCYIETSNLDGETNLKIKQSIMETSHIMDSDTASELKGSLRTEAPNNSLYTFEGTISIKDGQVLPLGPDQVLLRGAILRNTDWIYGICVFTGHESKLMRNATAAPIKQTDLGRMTNTQILLLFLLLLVLAIASSIGSLAFNLNGSKTFLYIFPAGITSSEAWQAFGLSLLTFIILYNNLIPISLIVTMEFVKLQQALLINNDLDMYYAKHDLPAQARSSSLVEELGQIEYIFSDKTGTLTRNEMEFRKLSTCGTCFTANSKDVKSSSKAYNSSDLKYLDASSLSKYILENENGELVKQFFIALSTCHTVIPERTEPGPENTNEVPEKHIIQYQSSSPDEGALVLGAQKLGFYFHTRRPKSVYVEHGGGSHEYEILNVCEFNSTRKRMSTIVRLPDGSIKLFIKGADTVIFDRLKRNAAYPKDDTKSYLPHNPFYAETISHLDNFASEGLRTLCFAYRDLSKDEYIRWNEQYQKAATTINNRQDELDNVAEIIEKDLILLGATAIEDKLQDGVPETIDTLAKAGIKIWVLTGDRQETAINIGYSCKLLNDNMEMMIIRGENEHEVANSIKENLSQIKEIYGEDIFELPGVYNPLKPQKRNFSWKSILESFKNHVNYSDETNLDLPKPLKKRLPPMALIIEGKALTHALKPNQEHDFLQLSTMCEALICCRVSPLQKALVVKLVKHHLKSITLAIGDGANDVTMIQAAHVGVGISGHEGLQAARSSDFAISQFKYLKKLLLVHGTWSYHRLGKLILYSFYKNIALYMTQFWFTISNGFSGQTIYESWTISLYNVIFTLFPPLVIGIFDQLVSASMLEKYPNLYKLGQTKQFMNVRNFWGWVINAIYQSALLYLLVIPGACGLGPVFGSGNDASMRGLIGGHWLSGTLLYSAVLVTVLLKAALVTNYWTKWTFVAIPGSFILWIIFLPIHQEIVYELQGVIGPLFADPIFWWTIIVVPIICISRDYIWKYMKRDSFAEQYHIVQEIQKYDTADYRPQTGRFLGAIKKVRMINYSRKQRGFAFSQNEQGQADLIRKYDTTRQKPAGL